ncbi:MAG: ATP-binding cassette domain-containing protein, partial [Thermoplasmata archaeon]
MDIIHVENLVKIYKGGIRAVDSINLNIKKGEIYGFLGPNGAGKTTTVKMLTTMIKPTSGNAIINGLNVIKDQAKVRKMIGLVPQDLSVDDDLKGIENLELQASFYGIPKDDARERANELLKLVDLYEAKDRYVSTYSGGMRKRLDLITGLIHNPEILFLDEPTLGLDVQTRAKMWDYISKLRKEYGITIFLTTHYLEEADSLCDRIGIIDHGKIVVEGSPSELKAKVGFDVVDIVVDNPELFKNILNDVSDISMMDNKTIRFKVPESEVYLPKLFQKIYENRLKIQRIRVEKPSLDSVFIKYT